MAKEKSEQKFRPQLPPVTASPEIVRTLVEGLGANANIVFENLMLPQLQTDNGLARALQTACATVADYVGTSGFDADEVWERALSHLREHVKADRVDIDVQGLVDAIQEEHGPLLHNKKTYGALTTLYGERCVDRPPMDPEVRHFWVEAETQCLQMEANGVKVDPPIFDSEPITRKEEELNLDPVAVRAGLVRDSHAMRVISRHILGEPKTRFNLIPSAEARDCVTEFVLGDIYEHGGGVADVAKRVDLQDRATQVEMGGADRVKHNVLFTAIDISTAAERVLEKLKVNWGDMKNRTGG